MLTSVILLGLFTVFVALPAVTCFLSYNASLYFRNFINGLSAIYGLNISSFIIIFLIIMIIEILLIIKLIKNYKTYTSKLK